MTSSLSGKTAIITGAANGVGLAIAQHFYEHGANVMCTDMDEAQLHKELGDQMQDGRLGLFPGDLRKKLTIANLLSATVDMFENIDILVNASRQVMRSDPLEKSESALKTMLEQNLFTNLNLSSQVAKRMIKQAEDKTLEENSIGTIINLSSIAARHTHPQMMAYSVSMAALEQMTRSLAVALAEQRIRVNAVAFGSVMSASLQAHLRDSPEDRDEILDKTPLGRLAKASEIAEAVRFFACEGASFITGQVLSVDGGRSLLDPADIAAH